MYGFSIAGRTRRNILQSKLLWLLSVSGRFYHQQSDLSFSWTCKAKESQLIAVETLIFEYLTTVMLSCQEETLSHFNALLLISLKEYLVNYSPTQESTDFLVRSNNIIFYIVLLTLGAIFPCPLGAIFPCPPIQTHLFTAGGITTVMSYGIISGSAILPLFNTICMRIVPAFKTEFTSGNIVTPVVTETVIAWHTIRAAVWHQKVWTTV